MGFPIRKSVGQGLFAAHHSLSQLITSFFGSWCQGIHHMLFLAWSKCLLLRVSRFAVRVSSLASLPCSILVPRDLVTCFSEFSATIVKHFCCYHCVCLYGIVQFSRYKEITSWFLGSGFAVRDIKPGIIALLNPRTSHLVPLEGFDPSKLDSVKCDLILLC